MKINIHARLAYWLANQTDILLQLEAAHIPEQQVESASILLPPSAHFARVAAHDNIGERIWLQISGSLTIDYRATVAINRLIGDLMKLKAVPLHELPGEAVQYLMASRYCPADRFHSFVQSTFSDLEGGRLIQEMRDWIANNLTYVSGSSNSETTAADSFISREGVCRDYAHLLITFARAAGIPARFASVYAPGVKPQDFHAVAEVFLEGVWHLVDATGMACEAEMAKIGVGRDAADVAFLTTFGTADFCSQSIMVSAADEDQQAPPPAAQ